MYKTLTKSEFINEFRECGRGEQFSYKGFEALYDYLEEEEYELDVIALCGDYTEYESIEDVRADYDNLHPYPLEHYTTVIEFDDGIIIRNF